MKRSPSDGQCFGAMVFGVLLWVAVYHITKALVDLIP